METKHKEYVAALETNEYNSIFIKRQGQDCFLIIDIDGTSHVFVNKQGKAQTYRHVWQVKNWLETVYSICTDEIEVKVVSS